MGIVSVMSSRECGLQILPAQTRKVVAFDSWTEGAGNIERLVSAFKAKGFELLLIHVGSWGHDLDRPLEERIGDLLVRDIRYYKGLPFSGILMEERPDAVLFLSTQSFIHRAFNRYCRELNVPTLHLYHGVVGVQRTASARLNPLNIHSQISLVISRAAKNLVRTWPTYFKALWQTRASIRDWLWFVHDVWRQVSGRAYSGAAAPDASTTACCVYTNADISHAKTRYRIPVNSIFPVGNPDLTKFGLLETDIGCGLNERTVTNNVIYIDTALIEAGAVFNDAQDFVGHLRQTADALSKQGYRLAVKLHPVHYRNGVADLLARAGIEICANEDFVPRLKTAAAAIVEPSSAALIPALLGLPLLLARHGKLAAQEYGDLLIAYPRGRSITSLDDFRSIIEHTVGRADVNEIRAWIDENSGPLPPDRMPERVVQVAVLITERCNANVRIASAPLTEGIHSE